MEMELCDYLAYTKSLSDNHFPMGNLSLSHCSFLLCLHTSMSFVRTGIFSVYHMSLVKLTLGMVPTIPSDIEISPCMNLKCNQMFINDLFLLTKYLLGYGTEGVLAKMANANLVVAFTSS